MRRVARRHVLVGLTFLAASSAVVVGAEEPTRLETARWAASLNARSAAGKEWMQGNRAAIDKLVIPILNECLPDDGEEVTAFSLFIRLSREGRVREVLADVGASLGSCMTERSRELQLPAPPRDDYWFQVNVAASL